MIGKLKASNAIIRRYSDDLLELADLRNAIVHERTDPNFAIAEPHDLIVKKLEMIEWELTKPKAVIPLFSKQVHSFELNAPLSQVLIRIRETAFSQFPIYEGKKFVGLITENGITNWLAQNVEEDIISIQETQLRELLQFEEILDNYIFISRATSIYEASEFFKEHFQKGHKLDAILITHSGDENETLLGIITVADIIDIP